MVGYLLGFEGENGYISIPLGGFCILNCPEKPVVISVLFEKYAGEVCKKGRYHIDICVFAHDEAMIRKLSLLQFGIESEKGVIPLENTGLTPSDPRVRKLSKDEKTLNWKYLWRLVSGLLSCQLLLAAGRYEYDRGSRALWVEHGTANPNAVGFWNRYFDSYCYSMVRDISVPTD